MNKCIFFTTLMLLFLNVYGDTRLDKELFKAVKDNKAHDIANLIKEGANPNAVNPEVEVAQFTPLHDAAREGYGDIVDILIKAGANIDAVNFMGWTPLHFAVYQGHDHITAQLIKTGANPNIKDKMDSTPLHVALSLNATEYKLEENKIHHVAQELIKGDVDATIEHKSGGFLIHLAAAKGYKDVVAFLIEKKAPVNIKNKDGWTPLHFAAKGNYVDVIQQLVKAGADLNIKTKGDTGAAPLHIAIYHNQTNAVESLLQAGADINSSKELDPVLMGLYACHNEILELLFKAGAKISTKEKQTNPLMIAIRSNCSYGVEKLIETGTNVNSELLEEGTTALHFAASQCQDDIVEKLIAAHAQVNVQDADGYSPLHIAVDKKSCPSIFKRLIKAGADINIKDSSGRTPLHEAAVACNDDASKQLIDASADINARMENGLTASHIAAAKECLTVLQQLIQAGANLNVRSQKDATVLDLVAYSNQSVIDSVLDTIRKYQPEHLDDSKKIISAEQARIATWRLIKKTFVVAATALIAGSTYLCCCRKRAREHFHTA